MSRISVPASLQLSCNLCIFCQKDRRIAVQSCKNDSNLAQKPETFSVIVSSDPLFSYTFPDRPPFLTSLRVLGFSSVNFRPLPRRPGCSEPPWPIEIQRPDSSRLATLGRMRRPWGHHPSVPGGTRPSQFSTCSLS